VLQAAVDTANGLLTKTEKWGEGQFIKDRKKWRDEMHRPAKVTN